MMTDEQGYVDIFPRSGSSLACRYTNFNVSPYVVSTYIWCKNVERYCRTSGLLIV